MAKMKRTTAPINFNTGLAIKFINPLELEQWQAKGFSLMVARQPNFSVLSLLTEQETAITKLLLDGNSPQQIADFLSCNEVNIRKAIRSIRNKLNCKNNIELVVKLKDDGLDSYLLQN
jgi:DNA-binding NarL/FixJ family response regulator